MYTDKQILQNILNDESFVRLKNFEVKIEYAIVNGKTVVSIHLSKNQEALDLFMKEHGRPQYAVSAGSVNMNMLRPEMQRTTFGKMRDEE